MLNINVTHGDLGCAVRADVARRGLDGTSRIPHFGSRAASGAGRSHVGCFAEYNRLASTKLPRSGLSPFIRLVRDDAGRLLQQSDASAYDLIFLDSERPEYPGWWPHLRRVLRPGGILIVDNATSHVEQMAPFVALVKADSAFTTCLVPVGNGEFLAVRR